MANPERQPDWLGANRLDLAITKILDAAGAVYAARGVDQATMADIATAAGCSRGTLYNHFADRSALREAFFNRAALDIASRAGEHVAAIENPAQRVVEAVEFVLADVRSTPVLAARFAGGPSRSTAEIALNSEVAGSVAATFTRGTDDVAAAQFLVRVILSLLQMPGADIAEERAMIERFVVPALEFNRDANA